MKKIRPKLNEKDITAAAQPSATKEQTKKFTSTCVDHLCGCKTEPKNTNQIVTIAK